MKIIVVACLVTFRPGTAFQIVLQFMLGIFMMLMDMHYLPFDKHSHDLFNNASQLSSVLVVFGALLLRVNIDDEDLQNKIYFDVILCFVGFPPLFLLIYEFVATEILTPIKRRLFSKHSHNGTLRGLTDDEKYDPSKYWEYVEK
eukprot:CAMPEP_0182510204 /NCGR_PEP_ID=MMETSP1321-20130603/28238_1 /TAXON_ID=91990 /ORGANISM="Bolidomonas sp., Strain RCC1657" /LENGTH=143 /DNA_ID=CAMNT_0024716627 /DNA_START=701 /DNA_END=1129 /DNA_ORIENTATION=+